MIERTFHPADYAVFAAMLLVSVGIGVYHAFVGGKQTSTKEFLMADRSMRSLPVALRSEEHRLNSSHANISYAVFCLKKKKT